MTEQTCSRCGATLAQGICARCGLAADVTPQTTSLSSAAFASFDPADQPSSAYYVSQPVGVQDGSRPTGAQQFGLVIAGVAAVLLIAGAIMAVAGIWGPTPWIAIAPAPSTTDNASANPAPTAAPPPPHADDQPAVVPTFRPATADDVDCPGGDIAAERHVDHHLGEPAQEREHPGSSAGPCHGYGRVRSESPGDRLGRHSRAQRRLLGSRYHWVRLS